MKKTIQLIEVNKSILEYFKMVMDFDNESQEYRDIAEAEFKEKLAEALNCGPATKEIWWINNK